MVVTVEVAGMKELLQDMDSLAAKVPKLAQNVNKQLGKRTKRFAKDNIQPKFPKRKGSENLKQKIFRRTGKNFVIVKADTSYAEYVESGTGPHTITARKGKRLNLPPHYPRKVRHPGARGYPSQGFLSRAADRAISQFDKVLELESRKLFKRRIKI
jgi:HK97 gp10 family phage protein